MQFEVFHAGLLGRPDIFAVDMIQYPGLWGLCVSHHAPNNTHPRYAADTTTSGIFRLIDACGASGPDAASDIDWDAIRDYTVTTHHVDSDAVIPVWILLNRKVALSHRALLETTARCGDLFFFYDETSAKINATVEAVQKRFAGRETGSERIVDRRLTESCFQWLLPRIQSLLENVGPFRDLWDPGIKLLHRDIDYLSSGERITEHWEQHLSLVTTDHCPDAHAMNTLCRNDLIMIWRTDCREREIQFRPAVAWYELASLPHRPNYDLASLTSMINRAEGGPRWKHHPGPSTITSAETCLGQDSILKIVENWIDSHSEVQIPAAYRFDVRNAFQRLERHAAFASECRFTAEREVCFHAGHGYGGIHVAGSGIEHTAQRLRAGSPEYAIRCHVADDFHGNRRAGTVLELKVVYLDAGDGAFRIEYDGWDDAYTSSPSIPLTDSRALRQATFRLENVRFGASQMHGADFQIVGISTAPFELTQITISRQASMQQAYTQSARHEAIDEPAPVAGLGARPGYALPVDAPADIPAKGCDGRTKR